MAAVSRLAWPPLVVTAVVGEDRSDQGGELAQAGVGQLTGVGFELAGVVTVDQFESQRDVSTVLGESGCFGAVTDGKLSIFGAFCDSGQGADCAHEGAGDGVERVERFHLDDAFPPVVACFAEGCPAFGNDLVEGVLDQTGEVGCGGQADTLGVVAAVEVVIAGEHEVQLTDAGEAGGVDVLLGDVAGGVEHVIDGRLELVGSVVHLDAVAYDGSGSGEGGEHDTGFVDGFGELSGLEGGMFESAQNGLLHGFWQMRGIESG
jgi:hypothetical protein